MSRELTRDCYCSSLASGRCDFCTGIRKPLTEAFVIREEHGQEAWKAIVDGIMVRASFNSKGAALAAIQVERRRRENRAQNVHAR